MKLPYYTPRTKDDGSVSHGINPPKRMRDAIGVVYRSFPTKGQAEDYVHEIRSAYDEYKARQNADSTSVGHRVDSSSVEGLYNTFRTTNAYRRLKPASKRAYDYHMGIAMKTRVGASHKLFGAVLSRTVDVTMADNLFQQIEADRGHHSAYHTVKTLRRIWNEMLRHGKVQANPFAKMGMTTPQPRTVLWDPADVQKAITAADDLGYPSIGTLILLCYHLCQRPGDMRQLKVGDYDPVSRTFHFAQEKTGTEVWVPASPDLHARVQPHLTGRSPDDFLLIDEKSHLGNPYDNRTYNRRFEDVRYAAKIPRHLELRDLRRTGATETAEAGATEDELRSITGHKSREVLNTYVRPGRAMAASGVNKRFSR